MEPEEVKKEEAMVAAPKWCPLKIHTWRKRAKRRRARVPGPFHRVSCRYINSGAIIGVCAFSQETPLGPRVGLFEAGLTASLFLYFFLSKIFAFLCPSCGADAAAKYSCFCYGPGLLLLFHDDDSGFRRSLLSGLAFGSLFLRLLSLLLL